MYNFASVYIVIIDKKIMKTLVIIPSRLSAQRLPGKPLMKINGLSIISHVFKKAEQANIGEVIVAAEDQEIVDDVMWNFEGHAISVWTPVIRDRKGTHADLFRVLVEQGYTNGKINGREAEFDNPPSLEKNLRQQ